MNIRAVVIDMDGTLLTSDNQITRRNEEAVYSLINQGIKVFLATGRQFDITESFHQKLHLNTPLICLNGAAVYDGYSSIPVYTRAVHIQRHLFYQTADDPSVNAIIHTADGTYCKEPSPETRAWSHQSKRPVHYLKDLRNIPRSPVLKYSIQCGHPNERAAALFKKDAHVIQWDKGFEIVAPGTSKWQAANNLLRAYGIRKEENAAFGDGPNDVEMLRAAGTGVAMGNASAHVKSAADFVTLHHDQDGLADYVERYLIRSKVI
ncbi:Cof-type HAD-IIB family hydrolase [Salisediminibacterium beveridgei]|uniref:Hydrolase (HAD superfamily) n=1 Tax=Salisediminibacterium beveridgei TaxID=632773 RepID=A0A1D7QXV5_9BACI|nr:Cof-type HAD-IIB family hydrolase [Salisediminibacterium beveridgei]AOM83846.1 Hydrolase (HAD superfamily) [Salisediminibacterium beveridgei]